MRKSISAAMPTSTVQMNSRSRSRVVSAMQRAQDVLEPSNRKTIAQRRPLVVALVRRAADVGLNLPVPQIKTVGEARSVVSQITAALAPHLAVRDADAMAG